MAELNARIIAKASATAAEEPQASDLEVAELAVNTADGKLFTKHTDGSVVTISSGGGAVDSVNGETGAVSLGIQNMNDYGLKTNPSGFPTYDFTDSWNTPPGPGYNNRYSVDTVTRKVSINWRAKADGSVDTSLQADISALVTNDVITVSLYNRSATVYYLTLSADPVTYGSPDGYTLDIVDDADWQAFAAEDPNGLPEGLRLVVGDERTVPTISLAEGDILQWVDADQKFEPTQLSATLIRTTLGIGEYVDDAAAGTGGVTSGAMYYNTTSSDYRLKS